MNASHFNFVFLFTLFPIPLYPLYLIPPTFSYQFVLPDEELIYYKYKNFLRNAGKFGNGMEILFDSLRLNLFRKTYFALVKINLLLKKGFIQYLWRINKFSLNNKRI